MAKQILCIENSKSRNGQVLAKKGNIYNSINQYPNGVILRGIDMWYDLEEFPNNLFHVSLFIDLPNLEGEFNKKKVEELQLV